MAKVSRSVEMLTKQAAGGGGSPARKQSIQPSPLLAQAESPEQSSALAGDTHSTPHGETSSSDGKKNVLTEGKECRIPNSTIAASAFWALKILQKRGLIDFVLSDAGDRYEAHFPVSTWQMLENNVLALRGE